MSAAGTAGYFARRWRGEVPLSLLLWRDTIGVGTIVNLLTSFIALLLVSQGAPLALAAAVHFSPLPYNGFLVGALWRSPQRTPLVAAIALGWLILMTVV